MPSSSKIKIAARSSLKITVAARAFALSKAQVEEFIAMYPQIAFLPIYVETKGDKDKHTSLRTLDKTDFFTREIDEMLLKGECDMAIHSAKDLPDPLRRGLEVILFTRGVDPRDALVFNTPILPNAIIATSSVRREEVVKKYYPHCRFTDIRGTIVERLEKLNRGQVDGVVIAEAALIRLKLTHLQRVIFDEETAPMQGKLAIVARVNDQRIKNLFH